MTEKRFTETISTGIITDNLTGKEYNCEYRIDDELLKLLNAQHETIQDQKRQLDELDGLLNKFEVTFEELEDILYMNRSRL